jgi:hypothetical protein
MKLTAYVINCEEVKRMPRMDGTGPMGAGAMTGRGLGLCTGLNEARYGIGRGRGMGFGPCRGRGFGRGFVAYQTPSKTPKELLEEEKNMLQERLKMIDGQLENL